MDILGFAFTVASMFMALFTFFHARKYFYMVSGMAKRVYLLIMVLCLIFCGLKRQELVTGEIIDVYIGQAIFYGLYNTIIFCIITYLIGTEQSI